MKGFLVLVFESLPAQREDYLHIVGTFARDDKDSDGFGICGSRVAWHSISVRWYKRPVDGWLNGVPVLNDVRRNCQEPLCPACYAVLSVLENMP
jgi:hypothetical protein